MVRPRVGESQPKNREEGRLKKQPQVVKLPREVAKLVLEGIEYEKANNTFSALAPPLEDAPEAADLQNYVTEMIQRVLSQLALRKHRGAAVAIPVASDGTVSEEFEFEFLQQVPCRPRAQQRLMQLVEEALRRAVAPGRGLSGSWGRISFGRRRAKWETNFSDPLPLEATFDGYEPVTSVEWK